MRVGSNQAAHSFPRCKIEQVHAKVLAVRIRVNFQGFIKFSRLCKDARPIGLEALTMIVNAPARMPENLDIRILQGCDVALGLITRSPQRRMERSNYKVEFRQRAGVHVTLAVWIEVQFDSLQYAKRPRAQIVVYGF